MNMNRLILLTIISIFIITSCNNTSEQNLATENITKLETKIYGDSTINFNPKDVTDLIVAYTNFVQNYPDDSNCPVYLFKAGELSMNMNLASQAITNFSKIQRYYPESERYPYSIFLQAFVFDTQLKNEDRAREFYQKFIKEFPDHELTDDAKASIENLGKTLDEIIKSFEEKNKTTDKE
jgi:TolA-binding protein